MDVLRFGVRFRTGSAGASPPPRFFPFLVAGLCLAFVPSAAGAESAPKPWTLEALQEAARQADPRVLEAHAEVSRLRGLRQEADAARWPAVTLFAAGGAPVPEATNDPNHIDDVTAVSRLRNWKLGNWGYLLHLDATLVMPLYTFGKISAYQAAASSGLTATERLHAAAQDQAARDAAQAFWGFQFAREILKRLDDAEGQVADARDRVQKLLAVKSPQVVRADLFKLDVICAELRSRRGEAVAGRSLALEAARLLAGVPPEAPFALAEAELTRTPIALAPLERYLAQALAHRPEVAAAQAGVEARRQLVLEKERERYPDFVAVGSVNVNYSNAATPQTNPFAYDPYNGRSAGLGLGLRWIFDLPKQAAQIAQAEAD